MAYEYKLPSLGDGVTGKVSDILVKAGDTVTKDQIVLIVSTDKVDAEMPIDQAGTITEIVVNKGDDVAEGSIVLRMEAAGAVAAPATPAPATPAAPVAAAPAAPAASVGGSHEFKLPSLGDGVTGKVSDILVKAGDTVSKDQIVLVVSTDKVDAEMPIDVSGTVEAVLVNKGDEVNEGTAVLRLKTSGSATPVVSAPAPAAPVVSNGGTNTVPAPAATSAAASTGAGEKKGAVRVSPLARKRAKELGVNLSDVRAADGAGRLSYKDVLEHVKQKMSAPATTAAAAAAPGAMAHKPLPNFEKFGPVERQPQSRIGVLTADNMVYAFNAIPHAWISEKADITALEALRQQYKEQVKAAGGNLTTTAMLAKAVSQVLRKMPQFNTSYDIEKREVIYKKFYNVGIAVDTPRGLLVPVLHNVDRKGLTEISVDLTELSTRTRDGKNKPEDMEGGTFTISNIGGIGGTNMISIVNWPQVAILSIVAAQKEPVWNEETSSFEPRLMMPMTIGWDHRVINGADAARFLVELKRILENPTLLMF
ncbi:MAG: 2-oxo acid dehydrogenase subunit E2 [Chitinophagales bacterium]|nr:2-oxo acid dehydrogenase subunit E2 [Chitinophagales bacterium]